MWLIDASFEEQTGVRFYDMASRGVVALCLKHHEPIPVSLVEVMEKDLRDVAREALNRCPKHIEELERSRIPTIWPNAGEEGGAEL